MKQFAFILFFIAIHNFVWSNRIEVGSNKLFKSIKTALTKINNGDTLFVYEGLYKEGNIVIDKSIMLIGINFPVLDGQKKFEVLSVKSANTVICGFKIIHSGYATLDDPCGIKVYDTRNVTIRDNF